jgi:hypothetical protein
VIKSVLKTSGFGHKPGDWMFFNCPFRKIAEGAIDIFDILGFSQTIFTFNVFLQLTHKSTGLKAAFQMQLSMGLKAALQMPFSKKQ